MASLFEGSRDVQTLQSSEMFIENGPPQFPAKLFEMLLPVDQLVPIMVQNYAW